MRIKNRLKKTMIFIYDNYISRMLFYINPKISPNIIFKHVFKRNINWNNPTNLQEKTFWLLLTQMFLYGHC